MKKTTKTENFNAIIEVLKANNREDLVEVIQHEIDLIAKKKANGKLTKTQTANEDIKAVILEELATIGTPVSITDLIAKSPRIAEMTNSSNQKVSALMTQLKNENKVVRTQDKKKAMFSVAEEE